MSEPEELLAFQIKAAKLPAPMREARFHRERKWRSDFCWPHESDGVNGLIVEVEGGQWVAGRHTRGAGFTADCEKYNEATLMGYRVLRVTPAHVQSGQALRWIERALA